MGVAQGHCPNSEAARDPSAVTDRLDDALHDYLFIGYVLSDYFSIGYVLFDYPIIDCVDPDCFFGVP